MFICSNALINLLPQQMIILLFENVTNENFINFLMPFFFIKNENYLNFEKKVLVIYATIVT